ncbi:MAG: DMT family transporter [Anaerolineae bacterium]|nr:DMT family transporter [Anaerolineae bacterium]
MEKTTDNQISPVLILVLGILAVSTASTFIRLAQDGVSSIAIAAWRMALASLILAPFALTNCRQEWRRLQREDWLFAVLSGLMLAVHFATWITSLGMTSVAASVVLVNTNPVFVGIISHFILKERMRHWMTGGLFIAIAGTIIISLGDAQHSNHQLVGDLFALGGAVSVAIYLLIGRQLRNKLSLLGYVFPVYSIAALGLMLFALLSKVDLVGIQPGMWVWLWLLAIIPQIIGHSSFNWALGHVPATYVALSALAEPLGSTALAWIFLGEVPSGATIIGGIFILAGISIASRQKALS